MMIRVWLFALVLYVVACRYHAASLPRFEAIGCFKDVDKARALPDLIASFRGAIDWSDMTKTVKQCAQAASDKGFRYFSLQFYGECWSGKTAGQTYDKYGASDNCWENVGKKWTNFVYRFTGK